MENPKTKNGYVRIANEILEALTKTNLSGCELRLILHVIRRTYGYNRKEDWISYTQFEKTLKLCRMTVFRTIETLVAKKLLVVTKLPQKTIYGLNKHYSEWTGNAHATSSVDVTRLVAPVLQKVVAPTLPTKDKLTKDNLQKTVTTSGSATAERKKNYKIFKENFSKAHSIPSPSYQDMKDEKFHH